MATYIVSFPNTSVHDSITVTARSYAAAVSAAAAEAGVTLAGLVEEGRDRPTATQPGERRYTARYAARGAYIINAPRVIVVAAPR